MTNASDFLKGAPKRSPQPAPHAEPEDVPNDPEPEVKDDTPKGVVEVELPSGIQVYYQSAPKRLYRVRQLLQPDAEAANWVEVPSMSTVTKILDKPGLVHWGEKVGINMVQSLYSDGKIDDAFLRRQEPRQEELRDPPWFKGDHIQELGKQAQLANYHMKDIASNRGQSVHDALEGWAMTGKIPDVKAYPPEEAGYVQGLVNFLTESKFEAEKSEVIVASVEHRVAGRFDLVGKMPEANLVYHLTGKSEKRKLFKAGTKLLDLKTSKGVYEEYHLQTAGYMGCMVESGYEMPESAAILRVTKDGRYELVDCAAEWLDFWWLRGLYDALEDVKRRAHQNYRKEH